jgi:pilus assembly protein TadC
MRNIAMEMRKRRRKAAEERAQKAPIKLLFSLVFLIFPTMFIVLGPSAMCSMTRSHVALHEPAARLASLQRAWFRHC